MFRIYLNAIVSQHGSLIFQWSLRRIPMWVPEKLLTSLHLATSQLKPYVALIYCTCLEGV